MKTSFLSRSISPFTTKNCSSLNTNSPFYNRLNSTSKKHSLSKLKLENDSKYLNTNPNQLRFSSFMMKEKVETVISETETSDIDDIKRIKKLFLIYSNNSKKIVSQKYLKLLSDARIIDGSFDNQKADILYAKETKYSIMDFSKFCDVLVLISQIKFPDTFLENKQKCVNKLISLHLFPLLDKISINNLEVAKQTNNSNINHLLIKLNNNEIKKMIEDNFMMFKVIYENYFPWEKLNIAYSQKKNLSEKGYGKFLEDFQICPNLISIKRGIEIFEEMYLKNTQILDIFKDFSKYNLGSSFTVFFFISSIYLIAVISYDCIIKAYEERCRIFIYLDRFFLILEKIHKSQALIMLSNFKNANEFNELDKKFSSTAKSFHNTKENCLDEFFTTINHTKTKSNQNSQNNTQYNTNENIEIINNLKMSKSNFGLTPNLTSSQTQGNSKNTQEFRNLDDFDYNSKFFSQHKLLLTRIFKFYCSLSDCTNYIYMNFSSFARLMSDCGILEKIEKERGVNVEFPFKLRVSSCNKFEKRPKSPNLNKSFGFSNINSLFSKFSSEYDLKLDYSVTKNLNNKRNYIYFTTTFNKFNINKVEKEKTKVFSNKKINFNEFMKILIYISHKIYGKTNMSPFSSTNKQISPLIKARNSENLNMIDPIKITLYLDKFVNEFLIDIYKEIEFIFDNEEQDYTMLHELYSDDNIQSIINKFKPPIAKIYEIYTKSKGYMFFEEFYKFCLEFGIFPELLQKSRIYNLFIHFVDDFDQMIINGNNNFNINLNQFISLIIFCAIDSKNLREEENDYIEKIIMFLEKMAVSQGMKNLTIYTGCGKLAADYNNTLNYFKLMIEKPKKKTNNTFKEIYLNK